MSADPFAALPPETLLQILEYIIPGGTFDAGASPAMDHALDIWLRTSLMRMPVEVLQRIFNVLSSSDLATLTAMSKVFREGAMRTLRNRIRDGHLNAELIRVIPPLLLVSLIKENQWGPLSSRVDLLFRLGVPDALEEFAHMAETDEDFARRSHYCRN